MGLYRTSTGQFRTFLPLERFACLAAWRLFFFHVHTMQIRTSANVPLAPREAKDLHNAHMFPSLLIRLSARVSSLRVAVFRGHGIFLAQLEYDVLRHCQHMQESAINAARCRRSWGLCIDHVERLGEPRASLVQMKPVPRWIKGRGIPQRTANASGFAPFSMSETQ